MNRLIVASTCCLLAFIFPTVGYAISAQWDLDPVSGDWNTAANWTPMGVPNGPADTATFGFSHTTDVSTSSITTVDSIIFDASASAFTINARHDAQLTPTATPLPTPRAPSNLLASAVGCLYIKLSWTDHSTNENGFKVERSMDGVNFNQINIVGQNVTTYLDNLGTSGLRYYRLRAYNGAGKFALLEHCKREYDRVLRNANS